MPNPLRFASRLAFMLGLCLLACSDDDAGVQADPDSGREDAGERDSGMTIECEDCSLETVMPKPGIDCGLQGSEGRSPDVASCVRDALESSEPFHAVAQIQGTDSELAIGWVQDEEGTLTRYFYDSSICGGSGCETAGCGPRVSVSICLDPQLIPDADGGVGFETGDELITCGSEEARPNACAPQERT